MTLKLYVWENVLEDYTSGMVCVLANNEEEAFNEIWKKDTLAWSLLQNIFDSMSWGSEEIKSMEGKKGDLCELQRKYLKQEGIILHPNRIKPKVITKPEAFVVFGGG